MNPWTPSRETYVNATTTGLGTYTPPDAPTVFENDGEDVTPDGLEKVSTKKDIVLKKNDITMVFAKRLAGAVYRMTWKKHLVIPELESNGGSLQVALAFDIPLGESPEVENPTEAGNVRDVYGKTTSKWMRAAASDSEVFTETQMAYFYPPGDKVPSSDRGSRARGRGLLSDTFIKKRVTIGWHFSNVVNFDIHLRWSGDHYFANIQILTVYLSRDFDTLYLAKDGEAVRRKTPDPVNDLVASSPPDTAYPIIVAKSKSAAVGLYAYSVPKLGRYKPTWQPWYQGDTRSSGGNDSGKGLVDVKLTPVTALWQWGDPANNGARIPKKGRFGCCLVFGSVDKVAKTIDKLSRLLAREPTRTRPVKGVTARIALNPAPV